MRSTEFRDSPLAIATMLTPTERVHVDAVGAGSYLSLHRDRVTELVSDLKAQRADAVVVSVARCDGAARPAISAMLREFPRVPTVALLSGPVADAPTVALSLGTSGVRRLVDVNQPNGWRELRRYLLSCHAADIQREALARLAVDLSGATDECWRFFEALFLAPPRVSTVRQLSRDLGVLPSTLMSRFYRAQLPAPKRYLAMARLVRAARLFENPGFSVTNVANHLDYSSPQSFGRHLRSLIGLNATQFRDRYDGTGMLEYFRDALVLPYLGSLRVLRPVPPVVVPGRVAPLH
jgi:AraC-like DNA-binding protein